MAMTALIIGGTGQIGRATAATLLTHGWEVTGASRSGKAVAGTRAIAFDRDDTAAVLDAATGKDLVLDTVAYDPVHAAQLAALAGSVGSLVVISTASVYRGDNGSYLDVAADVGFPLYPVPITEHQNIIDNDEQTYSPLKAAMERILLATPNLPVSILRPGAIHGPFSPALREWFFVKRVLDGRQRVVLSWNASSRFGSTSTANIAELVRLCAEQPGVRALNATDDEHPSTREIAEIVFSAMGHEAEVIALPGAARDDGLGNSPWGIPHPFVMSGQRAKDELGFAPVLSYAEGVRLDIDWVVDAVATADRRGESWQQLFPSIVQRYGAEGWFPYGAEDEYAAARR